MESLVKTDGLREAKVEWGIRKYANVADAKAGKVMETIKFDGNIMLNEGINELWTLACSGSGTKFDAANAHLGVGDSDAAEAADQTGLQATTNKIYKPMEGGFPTFGTAQQATWKASFGANEANWDWREFTIANGNSDAAKNLNRKVSSQGTKAVGQVWELSLTVTLS